MGPFKALRTSLIALATLAVVTGGRASAQEPPPIAADAGYDAPAHISLVEGTAILERDGEALLARGRSFPVPMYSCLAGFVEPGESLEEAVHREVREEVGVTLDSVTYVASQPWPFPHSLMIGFEANWAAGDIEIDPKEIVDAGWFRPDDLPMIPPTMSIARTLIDRWVARTG